ncbi:unnamed protein product [Dracunculus medinensis]|uniref:ShKT domain-containing protein n=1 Tax=Dracunculus medinensis TaxID=318479 RepID=A0A0N4U6J8_DRAME|nr:unnamed protein product [Dracunculus medinensis]
MVQLHSPTRDLEDIEIRQDKFSEGPAQESSSEEHRGLYAICHIPYQSPAFIITVFRPCVGNLCPTGYFCNTTDNKCYDVTPTECVDRAAPGRPSDCPARVSLCNNAIYKELMERECRKTCGLCGITSKKTFLLSLQHSTLLALLVPLLIRVAISQFSDSIGGPSASSRCEFQWYFIKI